VSYTTPQLDAAEAVAALLTGQELGGFNVVASAEEQLPKYENPPAELKVDCVAASPFTLTIIDRGAGVEEECNVNIGVQLACDPGDRELLSRLKALTRGIARRLAFVAPEGFGKPREPIEIEELPEILEGEGRFLAVVSVTYTAFTEAGA
jgi:hypothetical protein